MSYHSRWDSDRLELDRVYPLVAIKNNPLIILGSTDRPNSTVYKPKTVQRCPMLHLSLRQQLHTVLVFVDPTESCSIV